MTNAAKTTIRKPRPTFAIFYNEQNGDHTVTRIWQGAFRLKRDAYATAQADARDGFLPQGWTVGHQDKAEALVAMGRRFFPKHLPWTAAKIARCECGAAYGQSCRCRVGVAS